MTTFYIDPTATFHGDGTSKVHASVGGGVGAYNTWSGISILSSNTYLQKAGTTNTVVTGSAIEINGTATSEATRIILGSYTDTEDRSYAGSVRPIVDGSGTTANGLLASGKEWWSVEDLEFQNFGSNGIAVWSNSTRACTNFIISNCICHDNVSSNSSGIYISITTALTGAPDDSNTDFLIENCITYGNGVFGIGINSAADRGIVRGCTAYGNGFTGNGWDIWAQAHNTEYDSTGWTLDTGTRYFRAYTDPVLNVMQITAANVLLTDAGATSTPAVGEFGVTGGNLYIDTGYDANTKRINIQNRYCRNIIFENCIGHTNAGADGTAIGLDEFAHGIIRYCVAYGSARGIQFNQTSEGCETYGNIIHDCTLFGIRPTRSYPIKIYNNVIIDSLGGIGCGGDGADMVLDIYNNVIQNCTTGLIDETSGSVINEGHNYVYNCTTNYDGGILDNTSSTVDPEIDSNYIPSTNSPVYQAGKMISFSARDFKGHKFNNPPTIGAYEFTSRSFAKSGRDWT